MIPYSSHTAEVLDYWKVVPEQGLSEAEAKKRLAEVGENMLKAQKHKTIFQRFLDQFKDVMILILIIAALISFVVAFYESEAGGFFEPILILLIVVINAMMGVLQESKAEKALEALKKMSALQARVTRDGRETIIDAASLVPGDIISLDAGGFIPADSRLIRSASLKSEESALTGESMPTDKDANLLIDEKASLGDRFNMIYSGCSITYGRGQAVVVATGMKTEMGKIAHLLESETEGLTPLQQKLAGMGKYLGLVALAACAVVFFIGVLDGIPIMEIFMTAVSLAVSAIPEGLPAIVTIVLSIGVERMVRKNAIIRRLPAVETLGSASVICSDKTGTLTQNRMTLVKAYDAASQTQEDITDNNTPDIRRILKLAALCCDGSVEFDRDNQVRHIGDPTETSIILAAHRNGMPKNELNRRYPRLAELPFDSDRKMMTTVNHMDGKNIVIVKGAFDVLATRCVAGEIESGRHQADNLGSQALRVLAIAWKELADVPQSPAGDDLENGLTFLGLVGMIDPPRPEAREAVAICRSAGIRPVMITGDHVATATAIARDLGILNDDDQAVTGSELSLLSDEELDSRVRGISVYARVSPEDKIRIVRAWQHQGEVVAMTGDGVNDAPALKAADIGCAMGITGTDVAKGAADMTLTDDNFATIVDAVREGRGIYDNIKKAVAFLLGTNTGEPLTVFFAMIIWRVSPLISMQLLWINLVTDSLPAIALGMEQVEPDVMHRKPKPRTESIFAHGMGVQIILQGILFAGLTLAAFMIGRTSSDEQELSLVAGRTMAFIVLALIQVFHAFNMRSSHSLRKIGFFTNRNLNRAALISLTMMAVVVFVVPIATLFGLAFLQPWMYLAALGLSLVPVLVIEIFKAAGIIRPRQEAKP